ncbi:unnamed protein product [Caenorhabditis bovis]|uniref:Calcineurin-like phosphoesterase domain-containing protein n=1 Tax=Caenorhabditis bovis TaxID=2654633 RepID=A0A8S1EYG8_9PELO|nr:unnamed protein product [Caenorhabditis bovis]
MQCKFLLLSLAFLTMAAFFFNEYLIFFIAVSQCQWICPQQGCTAGDLRAFMIADTHLLGKRKGHWLDKLKREWQMYRSYQSAVNVHDPDVSFFLGDLLDEGQWADSHLFSEYVQNFRRMFMRTERPQVFALAGNHDLGFHYAMSPFSVETYKREFNRSLIEDTEIKGHRFVLITSMALHGDGCRLCHEAEEELRTIERRNDKRPILLQHFPLYRTSDAECEQLDQYHSIDKIEKYRETWETLSMESTNRLIDSLKPLAVFNGHTHKTCKKWWKIKNRSLSFYEYTINSFSWRNGDLPAFLMVTIPADSGQLLVESCTLPSEATQLLVYCVFGFFGILLLLIFLVNLKFSRRSRWNIKYE